MVAEAIIPAYKLYRGAPMASWSIQLELGLWLYALLSPDLMVVFRTVFI